MSLEPFPDPGPEPGGPGVPGDDGDWAAREAAGEWQVPPGWRTGDLTGQDLAEAGFGDGGAADQMPPGPVLATLVDAAAGAEALAGLSDDELVGVIAADRGPGGVGGYGRGRGVRRPPPGPAPQRRLFRRR